MAMTYKKSCKTSLPGNRKTRKGARKTTSPKVLSPNLSITGIEFVDNYQFSCGNSVPVYEALTVHAFTQLVRYAKFKEPLIYSVLSLKICYNVEKKRQNA